MAVMAISHGWWPKVTLQLLSPQLRGHAELRGLAAAIGEAGWAKSRTPYEPF
jgi:hypothetical protein